MRGVLSLWSADLQSRHRSMCPGKGRVHHSEAADRDREKREGRARPDW